MLRAETPCDFGSCPYEAEYGCTCATYCSVDEEAYPYDSDKEFYDEDDYEQEWDDEPDVDECGFDPYEGCYTYDC